MKVRNIEELLPLVTGLTNDRFESDLCDHEASLREELPGLRILVIGGTGSIGSAVVHL